MKHSVRTSLMFGNDASSETFDLPLLLEYRFGNCLSFQKVSLTGFLLKQHNLQTALNFDLHFDSVDERKLVSDLETRLSSASEESFTSSAKIKDALSDQRRETEKTTNDIDAPATYY